MLGENRVAYRGSTSSYSRNSAMSSGFVRRKMQLNSLHRGGSGQYFFKILQEHILQTCRSGFAYSDLVQGHNKKMTFLGLDPLILSLRLDVGMIFSLHTSSMHIVQDPTQSHTSERTFGVGTLPTPEGTNILYCSLRTGCALDEKCLYFSSK